MVCAMILQSECSKSLAGDYGFAMLGMDVQHDSAVRKLSTCQSACHRAAASRQHSLDASSYMTDLPHCCSIM